MERVFIPSSMETVGESMFNGCTSLKHVTLSEGVKTLGISAFANCTSLETLTLPDSLDRMRHGSIANCTSLQTLIIAGENLPAIEHSNALDGLSSEMAVIYTGDDAFTNSWSSLADNVIELSENAVALVGKQDYDSLKEAIAAANAIEGGATVTLLDNITLGEKLTISGNVTISGAYTITRSDTYTGTLFTVNSGATLTLDGGLTIDGGHAWSFKYDKVEDYMKYGGDTWLTTHVNVVEGAPVATNHMFKNSGTLLLNNVTVQNSYATTKVGAFYGAANSVTVFNGATVSHIATGEQGAVILVSENNATVTIKGNTSITNNIGADNGGIVYFYGQGGTMNLEGGRIERNYSVTSLARNSSGTIFAAYSGGTKNVVNLSGTIITDNHSEGYATMYIHTNSVFNMTGGEISENTSYYSNVYIRNTNCAATIGGGKIESNWASAEVADIHAVSGTMSITGGTFTQDVSAWLADGYELTYDEENGIYGVKEDPTYGKVAQIGDQYFATLADAIAAAQAGDTITMIADTELTASAAITKKITLDLNGKTIAFKENSGNAAINVAGDLTLVDSSADKSGKIVRESQTDCSAIAVAGGKLTVKSGSVISDYKGIQAGGTGKTNTITIEGGVIAGETVALNINKGSNTVSITGGKLVGGNAVHVSSQAIIDKFTITGGELQGNLRDIPEGKLSITGGTFAVDPSAYLATGYASNKSSDGQYEVVKALVRVYADNNEKVKYFASLEEAMKYAVAQNDYVPIFVLDNITVTEPIVIADDRNNTMELQGVKLGGNTLTITSTFDGPLFKMESGLLGVKNLKINSQGDTFYVTGGTLNLNGHSEGQQFLNITSQVGSCVHVHGGTANVNGAKLTAEGAEPAIKVCENGNVNVSKWSIGTLLPTVTAPNAENTIEAEGTGKVSIQCGTFDQDVSAWLADGYKVDKLPDGTYGVTYKPIFVTGTREDGTPFEENLYFSTIYEALDYIKPRDTATIKLLDDVTITADQRMFSNYSIVINAEYVTLDLNGKTILFDYEGSTATCFASFAIYNKGSLTIIDSSEEKAGTIYSKTSIQGKDGPRIVWVTSAGICTIEGGNFISEQGDTMFYTSNSNKDIPTCLYIKGGYFEHTIPTNGDTYRYFNQQNDYQKQIIEISGGVFAHDFRDGEMSLADGFAVEKLSDGTWGVDDRFEASINKLGYETLADAIAAAKTEEKADTIKLLHNISYAGCVEISAADKLNLNGHMLTTDAVTCFGEIVDADEDMTGGLKVLSKKISLSEKQKYWPIYDSNEGCLRFYEYVLKNLGVKQNGTVAQFAVALHFEKLEAYTLLANANNSPYLRLKFTLTWNNMPIAPVVYSFESKELNDWANDARNYYSGFAYSEGNGYNVGKKDVALILTVGGLDNLGGEELCVEPSVNTLWPTKQDKFVNIFSTSSAVMKAEAVVPVTNPSEPAKKDKETGNGGDDDGSQEQ